MYNSKNDIIEYKGIILDRFTHDGELSIRIDISKLKLCKKIIKEKGIKNIDISYNPKCKKDVDFLKDEVFSEAKSIHISANCIENIDAVYELKNLESFSLNVVKPSFEVDFQKLPTLKRISFEWSKKFINIDKLKNLEDVKIWKYPYDNLKLFSDLKKIKRMEFNQSKLINLEGIEALSNLIEFELNYNRRLVSLKGFTSNHKNLKIFHSYSAPKLYEVNDYLSKLVNLEVILLSKVKEIDSLKFLNKLKKLRIIEIKEGAFKVADNDYEPLKRALKRIEEKQQ